MHRRDVIVHRAAAGVALLAVSAGADTGKQAPPPEGKTPPGIGKHAPVPLAFTPTGLG